jgi:mannose-1-phosphate guanylyltransferase
VIQPVILCGGPGRDLLQETAMRCNGLPGAAEPILVCNETQRSQVQEPLRRAGARPRTILLESKARGTAPALTLAAVHAVTADDPVLIAMPSDHAIAQLDAFHLAMERAAALAHRGRIVAFGVPPAAAETSYGYLRERSGYLDAFVEKPFASGEYLCNTGLYALRASVWIEAICSFRPDIFKACERAYRQGKRDGAFLRVDAAPFAACPPDSIECAVMERIAGASASLEAAVLRLDAGWSDVGRFADAYDRTAA